MKYFWLLVSFPFFLPDKWQRYHPHCLPTFFWRSFKHKIFNAILIWIHIQWYYFSWWNPKVCFFIRESMFTLLLLCITKATCYSPLLLSPMTMLKSTTTENVQKLDPDAAKNRVWVKGLLVESMLPLVLFENYFNTPFIRSLFSTKEHIFLLSIHLLFTIQISLENNLSFWWEFTAEQYCHFLFVFPWIKTVDHKRRKWKYWVNLGFMVLITLTNI